MGLFVVELQENSKAHEFAHALNFTRIRVYFYIYDEEPQDPRIRVIFISCLGACKKCY